MMSRLSDLSQPVLRRIARTTERMSLRWKIYFSLTGILFPVFALTVFIQTKLTRPLLEEEVRQIGTSVCRSLSTEIAAFKLLNKPDRLEQRLIEVSWLQPSIVRLDVFVKENSVQNNSAMRLVASNVADASSDQTSLGPDFSALVFDDTPHSELIKDQTHYNWQITYPIKDQKRLLGYVHAEVSLQLVKQVVGTFSKIALLGNLLALALLIGLLSYYLRRMIENERRLRRAEHENIKLTEQLHGIERQLFLNEKLAIMGQLTASFAHEIGTPLNSLSGHLHLLKEEANDPQAQGRIEIINSQVSRIEGIVKDFLASTHSPQQQRQLVDIPIVVERITKLVAPRLASINAALEIKMQKDLEPVVVVPTDLEQVLLNLTNNAIDAMEKSPNARVLTFEAHNATDGNRKTVQINVHDTGEGIAQDSLRQVLKPFYTTKAPGQGTGLGLTISQRLIKKYGGRLELESTLGKGTTVKVSLVYDKT
jgi:signal transduction histidine kinase